MLKQKRVFILSLLCLAGSIAMAHAQEAQGSARKAPPPGTQLYCGDNDFEPRIGHRCGQLSTVKSFTALGLGVSVLPQSARSATDPAGLVFRKFTGSSPTRDIALVRHRRRQLSEGAQLFAEAARAVVGPIPAAQLKPLQRATTTLASG